MEPLRNAMERGLISVRALDRCLRVAWTLSDLDGRELPSAEDVKLALTFRDKR
ncbi:putative ATPase with chaperone activity [Mycobacteroides chelonae]|nr:putative ATPase with chaperone activity [Mycobacteroides chelonae]